jgi:hypothetical protein
MRNLALATSVALAGCYGAPSPTTCYEKYVRDRRGDSIEDTYENCLARAERHRVVARAELRGEPTDKRRHSIAPWRQPQPVVVISNQVNVEPPPTREAPAVTSAPAPVQAPRERVFGKPGGAP